MGIAQQSVAILTIKVADTERQRFSKRNYYRRFSFLVGYLL